jgi:hypothetical protein
VSEVTSTNPCRVVQNIMVMSVVELTALLMQVHEQVGSVLLVKQVHEKEEEKRRMKEEERRRKEEEQKKQLEEKRIEEEKRLAEMRM